MRPSTRRPAAALSLSLSLLAVGLAAATRVDAKAPAHPTRAQRAAAAVVRQGLLRRSDLGGGWAMVTTAPRTAAALTCRSDRGILAVAASATWSQATATAFASGTSYGFAGVAVQRRTWAQTATDAMEGCLGRQFGLGSSHGVQLQATRVRRLPGIALPAGLRRVSVRRYEVSGTASGAGQDTPVTLDVVLVGYRTWIGEDEFSAADAVPPAGLEHRVAVAQAQRMTQRPSPSTSS